MQSLIAVTWDIWKGMSLSQAYVVGLRRKFVLSVMDKSVDLGLAFV